jgi:hypothetical protein
MLQQPQDPQAPLAVRDGQFTAVTCRACGCRLRPDGSTIGAWRHFGAMGGRDAQGHRVECVDLPHDAFGRVAIPA